MDPSVPETEPATKRITEVEDLVRYIKAMKSELEKATARLRELLECSPP